MHKWCRIYNWVIFTDISALLVHAINVLLPPFVANQTVLIGMTVLTFVFSSFLPRSFRMSISQEVFNTTIALNRVFRRGASIFGQQREKRGHRMGLGDELNFSNPDSAPGKRHTPTRPSVQTYLPFSSYKQASFGR